MQAQRIADEAPDRRLNAAVPAEERGQSSDAKRASHDDTAVTFPSSGNRRISGNFPGQALRKKVNIAVLLQSAVKSA
jgi:hypothetical protein